MDSHLFKSFCQEQSHMIREIGTIGSAMSSGTRGHISTRCLHIFRMDIWLQIDHPFWNSYKEYSYERLPVGASSVMPVMLTSCHPGCKAFFLEDCVEFRSAKLLIWIIMNSKSPVPAVTKHAVCWVQMMWNQIVLPSANYPPVYETETI